MESNQNAVAEPVVKLGSHVVQIDAKGLAALIGRPIEAAENLKRRSESQLSSFYDALVNSPDHLAKLVKRPTAKEKEDLPEIEGKPRPAVVAELVAMGYGVDTAETMFSNMLRMREAYSLLQFIPPKGTTWNQAYALATKQIGVKTRQTKAKKEADKAGAFQAAYISQATTKLLTAEPEAIDDPVKLGQAMKAGIEASREAAKRDKLNAVADQVFKALPVEMVSELIDVLNKRIEDWQTKQSATVQNAGATESPQGIEAPVNQPQRQAA